MNIKVEDQIANKGRRKHATDGRIWTDGQRGSQKDSCAVEIVDSAAATASTAAEFREVTGRKGGHRF